MAGACFLCASAAVTSCLADMPAFLSTSANTTVSSGSANTNVGLKAEFVIAATYSVEHEPMTMTLQPAVVDTNHIVTREAHLTIGGVPGETVVVTCDVTNATKDRKSVRDCGGAPNVVQKAIMSGQQIDSGVLLTKDLMPNGTDKSESTVTFDVTYM